MNRLRNMVSTAAAGAAFGFAFLGGEELLFSLLGRPALGISRLLALGAYYVAIPSAIGAVLGFAGFRSLPAALWLWAGFAAVLQLAPMGNLAVQLGLPYAAGVVPAVLASIGATVMLLFISRERERVRWGACAAAWVGSVLVSVVNGHLGDHWRPETLALDLASFVFAIAFAAAISTVLEDRKPRPGSIALIVGVACWALYFPIAKFRVAAMPDPKPASDKPQILVIDVSGLRADALSGPGKPALANLDDLASRSIVYAHAQSAAPWAGAGFASLLTGQLPSIHGVYGRSAAGAQDELRSDIRTLPEYLQAEGYATRAIVTNRYLLPKQGFEQGFEDYEFVPSVGHLPALLRALAPLGVPLAAIPLHAEAPEAVARARRFVRSQDEGPWLLVLQLSDLYPERGERALTAEAYHEKLKRLDESLEPLLDAIGPSTWVFVVSDHGMSLGEHAASAPAHPTDMPYGFNLYQEQLATPLIAYRPRNLRPLLVTEPVSTCDLMPTVLDLVGLRAMSSLHGRPLSAALGADLAVDTGRPILSEAALFGPEQRALLQGTWKYIERGDAAELYDLSADPGETRDLSAAEAARAADLAYEFPGRTRPTEAPTLQPEFLDRYKDEVPPGGAPKQP